MSSEPPLNILCLDGGGVRGLSSLLILRTLLEQLQVTSGSDTLPLPCEVFDLICGTSTGGLIALMLGRLRMEIGPAIECYLRFSEMIFKDKLSFALVRWARGSPMYDAATLETCVRQIIADNTEDNNSNTLLQDSHSRACRTFVVAAVRSYVDAPSKRFRTYPTRTLPADTCKIWEAARATTAAVTFFAPMPVGIPPVTYIDGALGGDNNPCLLALEEINEIFPNRDIGCFLSLGTGVPDRVTLRGSVASVARACAKLHTSCEVKENEVRRRFRKNTQEGQANPYFRFSVTRGFGTIGLDEWNCVEDLTGATDRYMAYDEQEDRAKKCVDVLKQKVQSINAQNEGLV